LYTSNIYLNMKRSQFIPNNGYQDKLLGQQVIDPFKMASKLMPITSRFAMALAVAYLTDGAIGLASCAAPDSVFNVGVPPCDLKKKKMKGVIYLDRGVSFTGADVASKAAFIAAVKTATHAARGSRAYPIWDLLNFEDNTGDPASGSIGNLTTATIITSDAIPSFRFGYNGTEARHARMAAMSGATLDVLFVDEGWNVYGTRADVGQFGGFNVLQAYADTSKFVVSDAVNQYSFRIVLGDITEYRDRSSYIACDSSLSTAVGLVNITMTQFDLASNVLEVYMIADGGTNLEPLHGAALDGLTWTITDLQDNSAVTVTSVATNATDDVMTITIDSTMWTAATSGDRFQLNGPTPAAMKAAGVTPFEFRPFVFEKP
jgi:hypothetical protein